MGELGTKIARDIKERFESADFANQVGEKAGEVHLRSIKNVTARGENPSGQDQFPLSQQYKKWKSKNVGSTKPDLESGKRYPDGGSKPKAMNNLMYEPDGNQIDYNFSGYGEAEEYMGEHTYGNRADNLPQRRWFPETQGAGRDATGQGDEGSSVQRRNADEVEKIIERYINKDRTIHVKSRVS